MRRFALALLPPLLAACGREEPARVDVRLAASDCTGATVLPFAPEAGVAATLLIFVREDCPIANRCAPALQRLAEDFGVRGVRVMLCYSDSAITAEKARQHLREYGLSLPALLDPGQELAHAVGATVTPEAAVVLPDGALAYLGRVDDRWTSYAESRPAPVREDLREALEEVLAGRPVSVPRAAAVGCYLEDVAP